MKHQILDNKEKLKNDKMLEDIAKERLELRKMRQDISDGHNQYLSEYYKRREILHKMTTKWADWYVEKFINNENKDMSKREIEKQHIDEILDVINEMERKVENVAMS